MTSTRWKKNTDAWQCTRHCCYVEKSCSTKWAQIKSRREKKRRKNKRFTFLSHSFSLHFCTLTHEKQRNGERERESLNRQRQSELYHGHQKRLWEMLVQRKEELDEITLQQRYFQCNLWITATNIMNKRKIIKWDFFENRIERKTWNASAPTIQKKKKKILQQTQCTVVEHKHCMRLLTLAALAMMIESPNGSLNYKQRLHEYKRWTKQNSTEIV